LVSRKERRTVFNGYETEELVAAHVKALLRELDQAERAGLAARAESVRAELRKFGHVAEKPQEQAEKRPRGRPKKDVEQRA
jgi:hypothetical protein